MPSLPRLTWRLALVLLPFAIVLAWCYAVLPAGGAIDGPAAVADFFRSHRNAHPDLKQLLKIVTDNGNLIFYPVYAAILIVGLKRKRKDLVGLALTYAVVQVLVGFGLVRALKIGLGCPRPGEGWLCLPGSFDGGHHALPSGHTTEIFGAVVPLALRWGGPLLLLGLPAALVGFSRVYLGWHHLHDVAFGMALGTWAGCAIYAFSPKERHEHHQ